MTILDFDTIAIITFGAIAFVLLVLGPMVTRS
jgi:hypothetical protein